MPLGSRVCQHLKTGTSSIPLLRDFKVTRDVLPEGVLQCRTALKRWVAPVILNGGNTSSYRVFWKFLAAFQDVGWEPGMLDHPTQ